MGKYKNTVQELRRERDNFECPETGPIAQIGHWVQVAGVAVAIGVGCLVIGIFLTITAGLVVAALLGGK